jgi:hypothetical protein
MFAQAKIFHALDGATTVIGPSKLLRVRTLIPSPSKCRARCEAIDE